MSSSSRPDDRAVGRSPVGRTLAVVIGAACGVLVGYSTARHRPVPTFAEAVGRPGLAGHRAYAVILAQDCAGFLGALADAARAARAAGASFRVVVPGAAAASDSVFGVLRAAGLSEVVSPASRALPRAVRALGHRGTPLLVVLDASGGVRFASPFPQDPETLLRWHDILPAVLAR